MTDTIRHFMWGYQRYFQVIQRLRAERVFQLLDDRFQPELFVVGLLTESAPGHFPACVEPEENLWIKSEESSTGLLGA